MSPRRLDHLAFALLTFAALMLNPAAGAAERYAGTCDVEFEGDSTSTLHRPSPTSRWSVVDTNAANQALLHTRLEIKPRQLSIYHQKRDANIVRMFRVIAFPA
jgi:hypothetical protein